MPLRLFIQKYLSRGCYKFLIYIASVQTRLPPDEGPKGSPKTAKCPSWRQVPSMHYLHSRPVREKRSRQVSVQGKGTGLGRSLQFRFIPRPADAMDLQACYLSSFCSSKSRGQLAPMKGVSQWTLMLSQLFPQDSLLLSSQPLTGEATETTILSSR